MYGTSYDDYAFTQDEIAAGITSIFYNDNNEFEDEIKTSQLDEYKKNILISKRISSLSNNTQIQDYILREILLENLPSMILEYQKEESLQGNYVEIALNENCLQLLIKNIFKENHIVLSTDFEQAINVFVKKIYADNKTIVYNRVSKIQAFIHNTIDDAKGDFAHLNLNKGKMRTLLSTARLHLNIFNIKNYNSDEIL